MTNHPVRISVRDLVSGRELELATEFAENEWKVLQAFIAHANALAGTEFVKQRLHVHQTMGRSEEDGVLRMESQCPADNLIAEFLHRLRPLVLQDEHASFSRTCGIIGKHFEDQSVRHYLKVVRDIYTGKRQQNMMTVAIGPAVVNSEEMLLLWLNSCEYHTDLDKKAKLDEIHAHFPFEHSKPFLITMLMEKWSAISQLASLIEVILGQRTTLRVGSFPKDNE